MGDYQETLGISSWARKKSFLKFGFLHQKIWIGSFISHGLWRKLIVAVLTEKKHHPAARKKCEEWQIPVSQSFSEDIFLRNILRSPPPPPPFLLRRSRILDRRTFSKFTPLFLGNGLPLHHHGNAPEWPVVGGFCAKWRLGCQHREYCSSSSSSLLPH